MNILFVSKELIAADLSYQLKKEGCNVKLFIETNDDKDCFNGMVNKTEDWTKELKWVGKNGLIVFDDVGYGEIKDNLRKEGYLVVGSSGDGDSLELDREYGQDVLKSCGVIVNADFETKLFTIRSAMSYIKKHKGVWVLKKNNNHDDALTYVGSAKDGSDVISILKNYKSLWI
ncbi:MAG: hypothetical protein HQK99_17210 [Nitrospirae bacterium]|nr:hypothetical protein [Nitrospirota bacterium]